MKNKLFALLALAFLSTLNPQLSTLFAQGTAFTYQGRLQDGAGLANGRYDLRFNLYDALTLGNLVAGPQTNSPVVVSNGLFTVVLDFGAGVFTGPARFLEIAARSNGVAVAFTALNPRQGLTPAPYAIAAGNLTGTFPASQLNGTLPSSVLNGTYSSAVTLNNQGNSFTGNGAGLANVNATALGGLGAANFWQIGGNAGTTPVANFVGTTDNQALTFRVNYTIAMQFTPGVTTPNVVGGLASAIPTVIGAGVSGAVVAGGNAPAGPVSGYGSGDFHAVYDSDGTVGGGFGNKAGTDNGNPEDAPFATVAGGVFNIANNYAATVAGGDGNIAAGSQSAIGGGVNNRATGSRSTIGGGQNNLATNTHSAVAGGGWNTASGISSFIGGGGGDTFGGPWPNTAGGDWSAILGGWNNKANGYSSVVGGGSGNNSGGTYSVVPGGTGNVASNFSTFAAGANARALHDNSFVWSDGSVFSSTAPGEFAVRANGGVRFATVATPDSVAACNQVVIGPEGKTNSALRLGFHVYNGISGGGVIQATDGGPVGLELNPMGGGGYLGGNWFGSANFTAQSLDINGVGHIQGGNNWDVTGGEGDFRVGNSSYRFKIGVANGGGGAGDVWMRAHGGTARVFIKTPGGTTFYSNEGQTAGVTMAANGTSWASVSDRNVKKDFAPVDQRTILEKLAAMPITQWHYTWETSDVTPHIGPMAQDFKAAFYPGTDDKTITTQEADGVALAAIQGLNQKLEEQRAENLELKQRLEKLERLMNQKNEGAR